jgi:uncharacterized protein
VTAQHPVVWFELWVPDVELARTFYGELFGWTFRAMADYDPQYWLIDSGGGVGGALLPGDALAGAARAGTVVYVSVADLTAAMERCVALGGSVERPVTAIGDGSNFAIIRDPSGTRLGLWSPVAPA